jgi:hypothetical protein
MSAHQHQLQSSGGNMMDMVKTQLMTMTMMSSMNQNTSNSTIASNPMWNMVYIGIATAMIDFIMKYAPIIINRIIKYYSDKIENSSVANLIHVKDDNVDAKTASITLTIDTTNVVNLLGQAVLYQLTNNKNTRFVVHQSENFILDQLTEIEMVPSIYGILRESKLLPTKSDKEDKTVQIIEVFSRVKTLPELRTYLSRITHEYELEVKNKIGNNIYYFGQVPVNAPGAIDGKRDFTKLPPNFTFTMKEFHTNRKFSNLFGPEIDVVRKRVNFFIENESWYAEKGIPYTLGVLLSGQAGAGKTSTIKCLAHETKRHIININLNNDITKTQLDNLFFNETLSVLNHQTMQNETFYIPLDRRIYVLEDIDCQSDIVYERNNKKPQTLENVKQMSPTGLSAVALENNTQMSSTGYSPAAREVIKQTMSSFVRKDPFVHTAAALAIPMKQVESCELQASNYDTAVSNYNANPNYNAAPSDYNAAPSDYNAAPSNYNAAQPGVPKVTAPKKCDDAPTDQVDLSFLLNLLDGVLETPGRIVIMTCNYPEKLDHALVRPGRVDVTAKFKKCLSTTIIEMIEFFYNIELPENTKLKIMTMNDFLISPAELGKYMFEDFEDYNKLIDKLMDISVPSFLRH